MIDDFRDWKADIKGSQISIEGNLTKSGLRQVLSVFEPPAVVVPSKESTDAESTDGKADPKDQAAYASQQYFQTVSKYLDDLRNKKNVKTIAQYGTWFNNYARKIDQLPLVHVDPELLDYGAFVSERLRDASMAVKGIGMNTRVREVNRGPAYASGTVRQSTFGAWSAKYVSPRYESQRQRTEISVEEKVKGAESALEIIQEIDKASAAARRAMAEKYEMDF
jgi:hypothetical protein